MPDPDPRPGDAASAPGQSDGSLPDHPIDPLDNSETARLERVVDLMVELATGNLSARLEPSSGRDTVDAVIVGVNLLAAELQSVYQDLEARVAERTAALEQARIEMQRLAQLDPLTGLANRTLFAQRMSEALSDPCAADRVAVLLIDLDQFKNVNDSLGHSAGDTVLGEVARRLERVVGRECTVARLGGDEFAVLLPAGSERALTLAARIRDALAVPVRIAHREVAVGASIGVRLADRETTGELLLRDADTAMYAAKAAGRNAVQMFRPDMHQAADDRLDVASDLAAGLGRNELFLLYQPIVSLPDRSIIGAEALVRWRHPLRGIMPPADFVPIAESTGLIVDLGRWVLGSAIQQLAAWRAACAVDDSFQLHVNLSPLELRRPGLDAFVLDRLADERVPTGRLLMELSETALMTPTTVGMSALVRLREAGVGIAVDDFGTGYSSISALRDLPIDTVKVDRSLLRGLGADRQKGEFLHAVLQLVRSAGLRGVVEGVETAEQEDALLELECEFAQGFRLGGTMLPEHFASHYDGRRTTHRRPAAVRHTESVSVSPFAGTPPNG